MNLKVFTVDNLSLDLLFESEADYNVAWNLDASVAPLLKSLGKERCIKLYETHRCFYRPFSIFYIPSKVFSVKAVYSRRNTNLYDLAQYFPNREEPESIEETQLLALGLLEALEIMKIKPETLASPVAIWERAVMNHLSLPTAWDMPKEAAEMAFYCSGKLWIEAYQIGYWK